MGSFNIVCLNPSVFPASIQIPFSFATAVGVRVGMFLGAGQPIAAKRSTWVAVTVMGTVGVTSSSCQGWGKEIATNFN